LATSAFSYAEEIPTGIFHGSLVSWEGTLTAGVISAIDKSDQLFTCRYDAKSFIEVDHWHVKIDKVEKGDPVKIVADRKFGEQTCYVLSLAVEDPPVVVKQVPGRRPAPPKPEKPVVIRHGRENIAGVVTAISPKSVTLRTREGERTFILQSDTRYIGNGLKMELTDVTVNQRLSVETSRNQAGDWEAFQLTWGDLTVR
jgi:hypothetical protein